MTGFLLPALWETGQAGCRGEGLKLDGDVGYEGLAGQGRALIALGLDGGQLDGLVVDSLVGHLAEQVGDAVEA